MSIYYSGFNMEKYITFRSEVFKQYAALANCHDMKINSSSSPIDTLEIRCHDEYGWFDITFSKQDGSSITIPMSSYSSPISDIKKWFENIINRTSSDERLVTEYVCDCEDDYYILNFDQTNEYGDGIFSIFNSYKSKNDDTRVESFACFSNYRSLIKIVYTAIFEYWKNHPKNEYFSWSIGNSEVEDPAEVLSLIQSSIIENFIKKANFK